MACEDIEPTSADGLQMVQRLYPCTGQAQDHDKQLAGCPDSGTLLQRKGLSKGNLVALTYSEMQTYKWCQRKHYYAYVERIRPKRLAPALWEGQAYHIGMAAHYSGEDAHQVTTDWCQREIARLSDEYPNMWEDEYGKLEDSSYLALAMVDQSIDYLEENGSDIGLTPLAVEYEFQVPVLTPKGYKSRAVLQGKVDGLVLYEDSLWLLEHKTAKSVGQTYINQLQLDEQVSTYMWAIEQELGIEVAGCIYNIARKQIASPRVKAPLFYREMIFRNKKELQEIGRRIYWTYREMCKPGGVVIPNPNQINCRGCPYWVLCLEDTPEARMNFETKDSKHEELTGGQP